MCRGLTSPGAKLADLPKEAIVVSFPVQYIEGIFCLMQCCKTLDWEGPVLAYKCLHALFLTSQKLKSLRCIFSPYYVRGLCCVTWHYVTLC